MPVAAMWLAVVCVVALGFALSSDARAQVEEFTDRLGSAGFDKMAAGVAFASLVVCLLASPGWLAVAASATVGLAAALLLKARPVVPEELRPLYQPPTVPGEPAPKPKPSTVEPGAESIQRDYSWTTRWAPGELASMRLHLAIDAVRLSEYEGKNPYWPDGKARQMDFQEFVTNAIVPEVTTIAASLRRTSQDRDWCAYQEVCNALAFAQSFAYERDLESVGLEEYWRYPIELLALPADKRGDCEDTSILAAAVLKALGHGVVMLEMPGHVALGVDLVEGFPSEANILVAGNGRRFLYCETTDKSAIAGQVPKDVDRSTIGVHDV
jgi:predicted transglutaminase-like cysteine proteinase